MSNNDSFNSWKGSETLALINTHFSTLSLIQPTDEELKDLLVKLSNGKLNEQVIAQDLNNLDNIFIATDEPNYSNDTILFIGDKSPPLSFKALAIPTWSVAWIDIPPYGESPSPSAIAAFKRALNTLLSGMVTYYYPGLSLLNKALVAGAIAFISDHMYRVVGQIEWQSYGVIITCPKLITTEQLYACSISFGPKDELAERKPKESIQG